MRVKEEFSKNCISEQKVVEYILKILKYNREGRISNSILRSLRTVVSLFAELEPVTYITNAGRKILLSSSPLSLLLI